MPPRRRKLAAGAAVILLGLAATGELGYALVRGYFYRAIEPAVLPPRAPVRPLTSLRGAECGSCHTAIYGEWSQSAHGQAMTEGFFLAEYAEEQRLFACLRCHAPLAEQQPTWVTGLASLGPPRPQERPNPRHDAALTREGVTCVVCHQQGDAIVGPVALDPSGVPHATRVDASFGANALCVRCHAAEAFPGAKLERELLATFAEHAVWRAHGGTLRCVECHLPPIERSLTPGTSARRGRSHVLLGPRDRDFVRAHVAFSAPRCAPDGGRLRCEVEFTNRAGHRLPTGEPGREITLAWRPAGGAGAEARIVRHMDRVALRERPGDDTTLLPFERRVVTVEGAPGPGELTVRLCLFERNDPLLRATGVAYESACETLARWTVDGEGRAAEAALPSDGLRGRL